MAKRKFNYNRLDEQPEQQTMFDVLRADLMDLQDFIEESFGKIKTIRARKERKQAEQQLLQAVRVYNQKRGFKAYPERI